MPTLVVVDMQPMFAASRPGWLIGNVSEEIRAAWGAGHAVVFLEYAIDHKGRPAGVPVRSTTHRCLIDLVSDYDGAIVAHKASQDGSEQVEAVLSSMGCEAGRPYDDSIRIVGVETGVCVARTANGLGSRMPDTDIVVVAHACNTHRYGAPPPLGPNNDGQDRIETGGNVQILRVA